MEAQVNHINSQITETNPQIEVVNTHIAEVERDIERVSSDKRMCNAYYEDIMQSLTTLNVSSKCPTCGVAASWHKRKDVNEHKGRNYYYCVSKLTSFSCTLSHKFFV